MTNATKLPLGLAEDDSGNYWFRIPFSRVLETMRMHSWEASIDAIALQASTKIAQAIKDIEYESGETFDAAITEEVRCFDKQRWVVVTLDTDRRSAIKLLSKLRRFVWHS
ncbi:MAG TPA: hypothetical protein ENJ50_06735 [Planctomycetaceae bacterium]|nr:hypothetical protein [Planctomycetaceae bacterium]